MPLNEIEEAKFAELKDKCRELKVPAPPEIFIGLQVHDKNGVLVFDDKQRGHSWTRNFYNIMCTLATGVPSVAGASFGAGYMNQMRTNNTLGDAYQCLVSAASGALGSDIKGIVIGTSDTAFSLDQYILLTKIAHGGTSGTMAYAAQNAWTGAYTAGTKTWKGTGARIFNNNSGASITVKEVGLISQTTTVYYFLLERSVLDPTVAVANAAQLTVTYEISMDFSAID